MIQANIREFCYKHFKVEMSIGRWFHDQEIHFQGPAALRRHNCHCELHALLCSPQKHFYEHRMDHIWADVDLPSCLPWRPWCKAWQSTCQGGRRYLYCGRSDRKIWHWIKYISGHNNEPGSKWGKNMGKKTMLLGIAVILAAIALSISNIIAFAGGIAGLLIAIIGFFMRDNAQKHWAYDCVL